MSWSSVLGPSLGRAAHLARASMDARMSRYEITPTQNHVLMYLRLHDKQASQCEVTAYLREIVQPGDLVITIGAGDIFRAGEALLKD